MRCNAFTSHQLLSSLEDLLSIEKGCHQAGTGCGDCKGRLAQNINSLVKEPREKKKELLNQLNLLDSMIREGQIKARREAQVTMKIVKEAMHL